MARPAPEAGEACRETKILRDSEKAIDADLLEHETQPLPYGTTFSRGIVAEDSSTASRGREEGSEEEHCGGLTGPVGAEETDQCAWSYLQVKGIERSRLAIVAPEALGLDGRR
jgi:hypothetical protein